MGHADFHASWAAMREENGFGLLCDAIRSRDRDVSDTAFKQSFLALFLFSYQQCEANLRRREPTRGTSSGFVEDSYGSIVSPFVHNPERLDQYTKRFFSRKAALNAIGFDAMGSLLLRHTPEPHPFVSRNELGTWIIGNMARTYATKRNELIHPKRRKLLRQPTLLDCFLVLDLVLFLNDDKIFFFNG